MLKKGSWFGCCCKQPKRHINGKRKISNLILEKMVILSSFPSISKNQQKQIGVYANGTTIARKFIYFAPNKKKQSLTCASRRPPHAEGLFYSVARSVG